MTDGQQLFVTCISFALAYAAGVLHGSRVRNILRNEVRHWKTAFEELYAKSKYAHLIPDPLAPKTIVQRQQKARNRGRKLETEIDRLTKPYRFMGDQHG